MQDQLKRLLRYLELRGQMKKARSIDSRPDEVEDLDDTECEHLKYTERDETEGTYLLLECDLMQL